jgi:hypothetical protein
MKRFILSIFVLLLLTNVTFAQDSITESKKTPLIYSILYNQVPDAFNYPLIGVVNIANGNHKSIQVGAVNSTEGTFIGLQAGLVNSIEKDLYGLQYGIINSIERNVYGVEYGVVNSAEKTTGIQTGFINSTKDMQGLQNGFINSAEKLSGVQIGFINVVDTLKEGVPIGYLSFVKHGGYSALEVGMNETFRLTLAYKVGIKSLYSFPILSLCPYDSYGIGVGFGFGSNISFNNKLLFSPEISTTYLLSDSPSKFSTLNTSLGVELFKGFDVMLGPSISLKRPIVRAQRNNHEVWVFDHSLDVVNDLSLGFKCAIRYSL